MARDDARVRNDRLKAALKANMGRRKAQRRDRAADRSEPAEAVDRDRFDGDRQEKADG